MAGDRTLTLKILGDTKQLVDSLGKGSKETESFGKQVSDISAKVVKSFVAIGAAVGAFSIAFAKAAAEDQQAANKLAQTIQAVTGATNEQIKAVERYVTATSLATGITDDELRPSFERLVRSTKDVEDAQSLLNLALDLSAATSKPLEGVVNALAKAYDGSYGALGKLGLGIDAATLKSKDFNAITKELNATYGEFSEKRSQEAIVKFERLQVAIQEAKEAVGAALLPVFERLGDWLLNEGVPRLNAFISGLVGDRSLSAAYTVAQKKSEEFGIKVRNVIDKFIEYKDVLKDVAIAVVAVWTISKVTAAVQATIALIRSLILAYNALKASAMVAGVATAFALNPLLGVGAVAVGAAVLAGAAALSRRSDTNLDDYLGGSDNPMGSVARGEYGTFSPSQISIPNTFTSVTSPNGPVIKPAPSMSGAVSNAPGLTELQRMQNALSYLPPTVNVTVNGAIDPISTARQIQQLLNSEASLAGNFSDGVGVSRFSGGL